MNRSIFSILTAVLVSLVLMIGALFAFIFQTPVRALYSALPLHVRAYLYIGYCHLSNLMARNGLVLGANTLTNLIPTLYEALDVVSREMIGFIPAVSRDTRMERAALNQTINIFIAPAIAGGNITPGAAPASDGDAVLGNTTMTITKSRYWPVRWNGEEQKSVAASGQLNNVIRDQFAQAFRAAAGEVEADLAALYLYASRAYGTYNAVPFGTAADFTDFSQSAKILDDNGAPKTDRKMVLGSAAWANLSGKQSVLFKANEAGTTDLLRRGIMGQVQGWDLHNSSGIAASVTAGTGASATTDNAGYAVGATVLTLDSAGTGTLLAGDIVTFAGDTNKYVIASGDADVSNGGTITLAEPGLKVAMSAATKAITVVGTTARNMFFSKSAIALGTRAPALPEGGDMADDRTMVVDPISGLAFEVSVYRQYRQVKYEVALAWGVKVIAPRHVGILIGV